MRALTEPQVERMTRNHDGVEVESFFIYCAFHAYGPYPTETEAKKILKKAAKQYRDRFPNETSHWSKSK